jgi:hypothetical protein
MRRGKMKKVMLPFVMLLLTVNAGNAEELALDCQAKVLVSNLPLFFHLDIDDNGLAYTILGETKYYTNEDDKFFRKNNYEITWGTQGVLTLKAVINRSTGEYVSSLQGSVGERGVCAQGDAKAIPKKF